MRGVDAEALGVVDSLTLLSDFILARFLFSVGFGVHGGGAWYSLPGWEGWLTFIAFLSFGSESSWIGA